MLTNVGWSLLVDLQLRQPFGPKSARTEFRPRPATGSLRALLEQAERLKRGCPRGPANARVNLALLAEAETDADALRRWLDRARSAPAVPDLAPWLAALESQAALLSGDAVRASTVAEALLDARGLTPQLRIRALRRRGDAYLRLGRPTEAETAYRQADREVEQHVRQVGLETGRGAYTSRTHAPARSLVALLVDQGRPAEAFRVARQARARALASLRRAEQLGVHRSDVRQRWIESAAAVRSISTRIVSLAEARRRATGQDARTLTERLTALRAERAKMVDEAYGRPSIQSAPAPLPPRHPDDTVLLAFPGRSRWFGFVSTPTKVTVKILGPLPPPDPTALAAWLLAPFDAELAAAARVRILPFGPLNEVDLHALPWRKQPLGHQRLVVYGLDITPTDRRPTREASPAQPALVVGDPLGDLLHARAEAQTVAGRLGARALLGSGAHLAEVVSHLADARWFHYAGHAIAEATGLGSALLLARGARLTVADVLTLPRAPDAVVLSACESGALPRRALGAGLAQAFVVSGAQAVIATSRRVSDMTAHRLTGALYTALGRGEANGKASPSAGELPRALQHAQRELATAGLDWAAYRVWVP